MKIEYWGVGCTSSAALDMTIPEISAHLLTDWVPSLPASVSSSFVGWPPFLTELIQYCNNDHIALREEAGKSERQWKSVLSWMIGVAGARHILAKEGYRWIAPVSAFYNNQKQEIDLTAWHTSYPQGAIEANSAPGSKARLRPDYLALRQLSDGADLEWAVVEAKGTNECLTNKIKCPENWHAQVRNIEIDVNGSKIAVPRHLVIATRVNPNAVRSITRRIQVRAWNSDKRPPDPSLPKDAVIDIATAHLFGIFRNIRLNETAKALAYSAHIRNKKRDNNKLYYQLPKELLTAVEKELSEKRNTTIKLANLNSTSNYVIDTDFGSINVEFDEATMSLTRTLISENNIDILHDKLANTDNALISRDKRQNDEKVDFTTIDLLCGVRLKYPIEMFEKQRYIRKTSQRTKSN